MRGRANTMAGMRGQACTAGTGKQMMELLLSLLELTQLPMKLLIQITIVVCCLGSNLLSSVMVPQNFHQIYFSIRNIDKKMMWELTVHDWLENSLEIVSVIPSYSFMADQIESSTSNNSVYRIWLIRQSF